MAGIASDLFREFRVENPNYDEAHIEVYIQWLADKIETMREVCKRQQRMLDWALKAETQKKLQETFDEYDRIMKKTGNS